MRSLGDADASAGGLANLADLAATATDDATNHVSRNRDVLGLDALALLDSGRSKTAGTNIGASRVRGRRGCGEVGAVAGAVEAARSAVTRAVGRGSDAAALNTNRRAVEDGAVATLLVVDKALADLPNSLLNAIWGTLHLDNALSGLGKHLLLRDHADAGAVLDLLDLRALAANDSTHLVVRDEEADGWEVGQ